MAADEFRREWKDLFWVLSNQGKAWRTIPAPQELLKRFDQFLQRWMHASDDAGNIMTQQVYNAILNQRLLAEKAMLSGEGLPFEYLL